MDKGELLGGWLLSTYAFSSGVRFFLAIILTSNVVLLFYTTLEVYTLFGMVSHCDDESPIFQMDRAF